MSTVIVIATNKDLPYAPAVFAVAESDAAEIVAQLNTPDLSEINQIEYAGRVTDPEAAINTLAEAFDAPHNTSRSLLLIGTPESEAIEIARSVAEEDLTEKIKADYARLTGRTT